MIELSGDIGSGKTTLTKGIVAGLGFTEEVPSPTFTVGRVYPAKEGRQIHHFDFYRLEGFDMATQELAEAIADPQAITIVEWAGQGHATLPADRLRITLTPMKDSQSREIELNSLTPVTHYLIKELRCADRHSN